VDIETSFLAEQHQPDQMAYTTSDSPTNIAEPGRYSPAPSDAIAAPKDFYSSALNHDTSLSATHEQGNPTVDETSQQDVSSNGADSALSMAQQQLFRCENVGCETLTFHYQSQLK
jgi:hypothetical protein